MRSNLFGAQDGMNTTQLWRTETACQVRQGRDQYLGSAIAGPQAPWEKVLHLKAALPRTNLISCWGDALSSSGAGLSEA